MKVIIVPIGSSSSGNSIYVNINNTGFLIDAGIDLQDVSYSIASANYSIAKDINAIFVSHTHGDHCRYINDLVDTSDATLYATDQVCNYFKSIDKKMPLDLYVKKEIGDGLYVTAFKTYHDSYGSCGFVFEKDGIKISSLTDTGIVTKEMLNIIKGSQIVIIESNHDIDMLENGPYPLFLQERIKGRCGHLSNKQCAQICLELAKTGTKHFLLAHLSEENNKPKLALKETQEALKQTDADIYVLPKYDGDIKQYEIEPIHKQFNTNKIYSYCLVRPIGQTRKYWYLDETNNHKVNDVVVIPFGKDNKNKTGTIEQITKYNQEELPFPIDMMKKIVG